MILAVATIWVREGSTNFFGVCSKDLQIFIDRVFRAGVPNLLFHMCPLGIPTHEHVPLQHFDRWTMNMYF